MLKELQIDSKPYYFEINLLGHLIRFYHEKEFYKNDGHAWAVTSKPDYTVTEGKDILAVFDAKNYEESSSLKGEASHKILGYLTNLDCGYGGLFFPNIKTTVEMLYPPENSIPRHHFSLKVGHYNMKPSDLDEAIAVKTDALQKICAEVMNRAGLEIDSFKPLIEKK